MSVCCCVIFFIYQYFIISISGQYCAFNDAPCTPSNNIIIKNHKDSEQWWVAFYIGNEDISCGGSITNVEIKDNYNYQGSWQSYNQASSSDHYGFANSQGAYTAPITVRITTNTEVIVINDIIQSLIGADEDEYDTGQNFCHTTSTPTVQETTSQTPTTTPTEIPTVQPSENPTETPSIHPSYEPSHIPTINPSYSSTETPTIYPSSIPTESPTVITSQSPSTMTPTADPSLNPTESPTKAVTQSPSTSNPTETPSSSYLYTTTSIIHKTEIPSTSPTISQHQHGMISNVHFS